MSNLQNYTQAIKQRLPYVISTISALLLGLSIPDFDPSNCPNTIHMNNLEQAFTRAEYERLKPNMPLSQVESILGRGTEISSSTTTSIYLWKNRDHSQIKITFEEGKLTHKEQLSLQ